MGCDISKGRALQTCKDGVAGVKNVYFINWGDLKYDEFVWEAANDEILKKLKTTGKASAYKYELVRGSNFDQINTVDKKTRTTFWDGSLKITLRKQDADTQKELKLLSYGQPRVLVEYYASREDKLNGKTNFVLMGEENGCTVKVDAVSGAELADFEGYNVEITSQESSMASYVPQALVTSGLTIVT